MNQFINEIKTGKRHINPKIISAIDFLIIGSGMILGIICFLEILGIDLIGFYK